MVLFEVLRWYWKSVEATRAKLISTCKADIIQNQIDPAFHVLDLILVYTLSIWNCVLLNKLGTSWWCTRPPPHFRSEKMLAMLWDHKFVFLRCRVKRPQLFLQCVTSFRIQVRSKIGLWLMATSSPAEVLAPQWSLPWESWRSCLGVIKRWSSQSQCFSHIHSAIMFVTVYFRLLETCIRYKKME